MLARVAREHFLEERVFSCGLENGLVWMGMGTKGAMFPCAVTEVRARGWEACGLGSGLRNEQE